MCHLEVWRIFLDWCSYRKVQKCILIILLKIVLFPSKMVDPSLFTGRTSVLYHLWRTPFHNEALFMSCLRKYFIKIAER